MKNNNPQWLENAVFYEIYPQSYKDTNADGIGDLAGMTESLPYIKSIGCNAIWINPCFESPFFDAGYDISNYVSLKKHTNSIFMLFSTLFRVILPLSIGGSRSR